MAEVMLVWRCSIPEKPSRAFFDQFDPALRSEKLHIEEGTAFFSVSILESGSASEAISAALAFLRSQRSVLNELIQSGGSSELDFGVLVGTNRSFAPSITFDEPMLTESARAHVSLRVSCYPTSDEEV